MQHWRSPVASLLPAQQEYLDGEDDEDQAVTLSISDQRTLYLVNIFFANMVQFLNSFSAICQDKLSFLHRKMLRLDASLMLLESRLGLIEEPSRSSEPVIPPIRIADKKDKAVVRGEPSELASQSGQYSGVARDSD